MILGPLSPSLCLQCGLSMVGAVGNKVAPSSSDENAMPASDVEAQL